MNGAATAGEEPSTAERDAVASRAGAAFAATREVRDRLRALREPAPVSTIEKDAEVGAYLRERFRAGTTNTKLHTACVERFGAGRAPSAGRIQVFRQRVRMQWRTK